MVHYWAKRSADASLLPSFAKAAWRLAAVAPRSLGSLATALASCCRFTDAGFSSRRLRLCTAGLDGLRAAVTSGDGSACGEGSSGVGGAAARRVAAFARADLAAAPVPSPLPLFCSPLLSCRLCVTEPRLSFGIVSNFPAIVATCSLKDHNSGTQWAMESAEIDRASCGEAYTPLEV